MKMPVRRRQVPPADAVIIDVDEVVSPTAKKLSDLPCLIVLDIHSL